MKRNYRFAAMAMAVAATTSYETARATVTEFSGFRRVTARSEAGPLAMPNVDAPPDITSNLFSGPFNENRNTMASFSAPPVAITVSGMTSQMSQINNGSYSGTLDAMSMASNTGGGQSANGRGSTDFSVGFTVSEPTMFDITANVRASRTGTGATSIARFQVLNQTAGMVVLTVEQTNGMTDNFHQVVNLLPGNNYAVAVTANTAANRTFSNGATTTTAHVDFVMYAVPEPGTLLLIAMGCCAAARRRRRGTV